jgi:hypothetical protein
MDDLEAFEAATTGLGSVGGFRGDKSECERSQGMTRLEGYSRRHGLAAPDD